MQTVTSPIKIPVKVSSENHQIDLRISSEFASISMGIETAIKPEGIVGERYDGPYEVDPAFEETTLSTANKVLEDDIVVNPIEVARVSNLSGGRTIYIGGLING